MYIFGLAGMPARLHVRAVFATSAAFALAVLAFGGAGAAEEEESPEEGQRKAEEGVQKERQPAASSPLAASTSERVPPRWRSRPKQWQSEPLQWRRETRGTLDTTPYADSTARSGEMPPAAAKAAAAAAALPGSSVVVGSGKRYVQPKPDPHPKPNPNPAPLLQASATCSLCCGWWLCQSAGRSHSRSRRIASSARKCLGTRSRSSQPPFLWAPRSQYSPRSLEHIQGPS